MMIKNYYNDKYIIIIQFFLIIIHINLTSNQYENHYFSSKITFRVLVAKLIK